MEALYELRREVPAPGFGLHHLLCISARSLAIKPAESAAKEAMLTNHNESEADELRGTTTVQALSLAACLLVALPLLMLSVLLHSRAAWLVAGLSILLLSGCQSPRFAPHKSTERRAGCMVVAVNGTRV